MRTKSLGGKIEDLRLWNNKVWERFTGGKWKDITPTADPESKRIEDKELLQFIKRVHKRAPVYGSIPIHKVLKAVGIRISLGRVKKSMQSLDIHGMTGKERLKYLERVSKKASKH